MKNLFTLLFLTMVYHVFAQPTAITYQGKLLDASGIPVNQTNMAMSFAMYDASANGNQLWPLTGVVTKLVDVSNGLYSVYLGTGVGDDIPITAAMIEGHSPWLEMKIGEDTFQRIALSAVPFALLCNQLSANAWQNPGAIGQTTPNTGKFTSLETGGLKVTTGALDGKVLTSDADGNASWQNISLSNFTESNYLYDSKYGVKLLARNDAQTNVDFVISPKGTGALLAHQPDGTVTGGNKRGVRAVDLQTIRGIADQVASGNNSVIIGGGGNKASGDFSFAMGNQSIASGYGSVALGVQSSAGSQNSVGLGGGNASGWYATAIGSLITASGPYSFASGYRNTAQSYAETVIGINATVGSGNVDEFIDTDRLFVVGNGASSSNKRNALTILKNANTTIGGSLTINSNGSQTAYTFPTFRGDDGQVLTTNGMGGLNWQTPSISSVTSVSGNAPISVATGTSTPEISIAEATISTAGSMSAADKTKLDAITGTNTGNQTITLTGDVTGSGTGSFAATISAASVTNAKMATMAANTIKVNNTASATAPTDLSLTANTFPARNSTGNIAATPLTDFALTILDDANAAAVRTTIGAGTGNGTVTGVTGTAPISVATGTTTPVVSIAAATTSAAGSMSAVDKTKLDGLVSSQWTTSGSDIYYNTGNVGIGTNAPKAPLDLGNGISNRKISLYATADNDHQFYGFGINNGVLRSQLATTTAHFKYYAATSETTSTELFRIQGNGQIMIPALTIGGILQNSSTGLISSSIGTSGQILSTNGSGGISWITPAGGTVTNVSGTAPISVATGTSTPLISIAAATTSTAGSMSSADKTKLDAITGTNTGNQTITLTGDVTGTGTGSFAATIAPGAVTNSKMYLMGNNSIKANQTGVLASPSDFYILPSSFPARNSTGDLTAKTISDFAFTFLDDASATAVRTTIGAGVGTVINIATSNGITGGPVTTTGTLGLTGQALALHNLGTNGLITRTASGTVAARTITAGAGITVTNGDGVSGNPTVAIHTYAVGDFAQGGIVFWLDETGQHGLVCAKQDQSSTARWSAGTITNTMAKGDGPLSGEMNTAIIIANQSYGDGTTYSARICNELQITENGKTYGDWYLPSRNELTLMYENRGAINTTATANGGTSFASWMYWSSTEIDATKAYLVWFYEGTGQSDPKEKHFSGFNVRAVRAF
jgi:hypothetical protein